MSKYNDKKMWQFPKLLKRMAWETKETFKQQVQMASAERLVDMRNQLKTNEMTNNLQIDFEMRESFNRVLKEKGLNDYVI